MIYSDTLCTDPILGAEIARTRKLFKHHLLTSKPATMVLNAQTTIRPYHLKPLGLSRCRIKWEVSICSFTKKWHSQIIPSLEWR